MSDRRRAWAAVLLVALLVGCADGEPVRVAEETAPFTSKVALPGPDRRGSMTLDEALAARRSVREFDDRELALETIGQLLWAAQGITDASGKRTAPSAGALYPLELYVVTAAQVMHYVPDGHRIEARPSGDLRSSLQEAAGDQPSVGSAPAVFVVAAVPDRTRAKYGERTDDFVNREVGHATQNLLLEVTSRGLVAVTIGSLDAELVARQLALPADQVVLGLVPVGYPKT